MVHNWCGPLSFFSFETPVSYSESLGVRFHGSPLRSVFVSCAHTPATIILSELAYKDVFDHECTSRKVLRILAILCKYLSYCASYVSYLFVTEKYLLKMY